MLFRPNTSGAFSAVVGASATIVDDEVRFELTDAQIQTGYYTLGLNNLTAGIRLYSRSATCPGGCNWDDVNSWTTTNDGSGAAAGITPNGCMDVVILNGHRVQMTADNRAADTVLIQSGGTLDLGRYVGHNFYALQGNGTLYIAPNGGTAQLPTVAEQPIAFFNTPGSTLELGGNSTYNLPVIAPTNMPNNVVASGGGRRDFPDRFEVDENLTLNGTTTLRILDDVFIVRGNTQVNANTRIEDNNDAGTNTFLGTVQVAADGVFTTNRASEYFFHGDLTNAGTFQMTGNATINLMTALTITPQAPMQLRRYVIVHDDIIIAPGANVNFSGEVRYASDGLTVTNQNADVSFGEIILDKEDGVWQNTFTLSDSYPVFNQARNATQQFDRIYINDIPGDVVRFQNNAQRRFIIDINDPQHGIELTRSSDLVLDGAWEVSFVLTATGPATANNIARLKVGNNLSGNVAELQINLSQTNAYSLTNPGGSTGGNDGGNRTVRWYVNVSGATITYTAPNNTRQTLPHNHMTAWVNNNRRIANEVIQTPPTSLSDLKLEMGGVIARSQFDNLVINPIRDMTITDVSDTVFCLATSAQTFNISYAVTNGTDKTHFNNGNRIDVQLSDPNGNFGASTVIGTANTTAPSGTIACTIPTGTPPSTNYRLRVVSSNARIIGETSTQTLDLYSYFIVSNNPFPGSDGLFINETAGYTYEVIHQAGQAPVSVQWGYRLVSGGGVTDIPGETGTIYTPDGPDFPTKGVYFVVAQITAPAATNCGTFYSNELQMSIACAASGSTNLVDNGDFEDGYIRAGNDTTFYTDYTRNGNAATLGQEATKLTRAGGPDGTGMYPERTFAVGDNPYDYHNNFCNSATGCTNLCMDPASYPPGVGGKFLIANGATNGSLDIWRQTVSGITTNTDYVFSFYAANLNTASDLGFGLFFDCVQAGNIIRNPANTRCGWGRYLILWNSGVLSGDVTISLRNITTNAGGNDMVIDNIEFYTCAGAPTFPTPESFVWKGYDNRWDNPDNWGSCFLPTCGDDVTIPTAPIGGNFPIININNAVARNIDIAPNANIQINSGRTLQVCGNLTGNGTFTTQLNANVIFISNASSQTISGNFTGTNAFANLIIEKDRSSNTNGTLYPAGTTTDVVRLETDIEVKQTLLIDYGIFDGNSRTASIGGAFNIRNGGGTHRANNGTIAFVGAADQEFLNSAGIVGSDNKFHNLHINQTAVSTVTLRSSAFVMNELRLTRGKIQENGNNLRVIVENTAPNAIVGQNADSYVITTRRSGNNRLRLRRYITGTQAYDFPVGSPDNYQLIRLDVDNPLTGVAYLDTHFDTTRASGGGLPLTDTGRTPNVAYKEFCTGGQWGIVPNATPTGGSYTLAATPVGFVCPGSNVSLLKRPTSGGNWGLDASTWVSNFSRTGYSSFSEITIGSDVILLPLNLLDFSAQWTNDRRRVQIQWITTQERDLDHFTLERSTDGKHFVHLGRLSATGYTTAMQAYTFTDEQPPFWVSVIYYRLRSTDVDGTSYYSPVRAVFVDTPETGLAFFPNPVQQGTPLEVVWSAEQPAGIEIKVFNALGQALDSYRLEQQAGQNHFRLPTRHLPAGVYVLWMMEQEKLITRKFIVH
ncbi:MAG: T9SS type A sorting domain-containing protein [Bernardetiaceae bacterium]